MSWSVGSALEYSVQGGDDQVARFVSHLVNSNYVVDSGEFYVPQLDQQDAAKQLHQQGLVECNAMGGYALTSASLKKLTLHWKLSDPKPVCAVRDSLALEELKSSELLLKLESQGFEWQPWPASTKKRLLCTPYAPGRHKVWYSTHAPPPKAYLLALLDASANVEAGVRAEIPHGQAQKVYDAILAGEPLPAQGKQGRKRNAALALEADAELPVLALPPAKTGSGSSAKIPSKDLVMQSIQPPVSPAPAAASEDEADALMHFDAYDARSEAGSEMPDDMQELQDLLEEEGSSASEHSGHQPSLEHADDVPVDSFPEPANVIGASPLPSFPPNQARPVLQQIQQCPPCLVEILRRCR